MVCAWWIVKVCVSDSIVGTRLWVNKYREIAWTHNCWWVYTLVRISVSLRLYLWLGIYLYICHPNLCYACATCARKDASPVWHITAWHPSSNVLGCVFNNQEYFVYSAKFGVRIIDGRDPVSMQIFWYPY